MQASRYAQKCVISKKELELTEESDLKCLLGYKDTENLEICDISKLKEIESIYFETVKSTLTFLFIGSNKNLEKLDERLLEGMINLETLIINNNPKLTEIPRNFFNYNLPNLKDIDLEYNKNITKLDLVFGSLEKLKLLRTGENIEKIFTNFPFKMRDRNGEITEKLSLPETIEQLYDEQEHLRYEENMLEYLLNDYIFFPDKSITEEYIEKCVEEFFNR